MTNVKDTLLRLIIEERQSFGTIEELLIDLYYMGLLDDNRVIRVLVKSEYKKRLQADKETARDIVLDLAVKYDKSSSTIENIIYKHPEIRI